jgi:hypothetical protein
MSSDDGMDSILGCVFLGVRGLLLLCPFMLGAQDRRCPRPNVGGAYP